METNDPIKVADGTGKSALHVQQRGLEGLLDGNTVLKLNLGANVSLPQKTVLKIR